MWKNSGRTPYHKDLPDDAENFDPNKQYTPAELDGYASQFLRENARKEKHWHKRHGILFKEHVESRWRREVNTSTGDTPDATITASLSKDGQTFYNRTHPQGRKVNSEKQRRDNGASYYRN